MKQGQLFFLKGLDTPDVVLLEQCGQEYFQTECDYHAVKKTLEVDLFIFLFRTLNKGDTNYKTVQPKIHPEPVATLSTLYVGSDPKPVVVVASFDLNTSLFPVVILLSHPECKGLQK